MGSLREAVCSIDVAHGVIEGGTAQAEVSVRLEEGEKTVTAKGADPDTLVASARAYVAALNKLSAKRKQLNPQAAIRA